MPASQPIRLHPTRVTHRVSRQHGWALEFNDNANDPAYFVQWADGSGENWFAVGDLEQGWGAQKEQT